MDAREMPRCWKCGYDLRGLRVEQVCPECGTPVWSRPPAPPAQAVKSEAQQARSWGMRSIAIFFLCVGPLAVIPAAVAIVYGLKARWALRTGRIDAAAARGALTGIVCGLIVVALSVASVAMLWVDLW